MGLIVQRVQFDGSAPDSGRLAAAVADLCGLAASARDSSAEAKCSLYDLHASLAFDCFPDDQIEVYAYRPGAVRQFYDETVGDSVPQIERVMQGLNEPSGSQTVYLKGFLGQEPTLFIVAALALERLGGRVMNPISQEDRQSYGGSVTPGLLEARRRGARKQARWAAVAGALLLPVLLPFWLVRTILTTPYRVWKAYKKVHCSPEER